MTKAEIEPSPIPSPMPLALAFDKPPGTIMTACILTRKRYCLVAVDNGGIGSPNAGPGATALRTDATSPGASEVFTLAPTEENDLIGLKTSDGRHYVTAVDGGGFELSPTAALPLPILTNGRLLQAGTVFHIILLGDQQVRLVTPDLKHYVTAAHGGGFDTPGDPIRTNATSIGPDERFELIIFDFPSSTHNGQG